MGVVGGAARGLLHQVERCVRSLGRFETLENLAGSDENRCAGIEAHEERDSGEKRLAAGVGENSVHGCSVVRGKRRVALTQPA